MRLNKTRTKLALIAAILISCSSINSARADVYSEPITVSQYSAFIPNYNYIQVWGSNLIGVQNVMINGQEYLNVTYRSNNYLEVYVGKFEVFAEGNYTLVLSNSAYSLNLPFTVFSNPIFGTPSPLTGDKKGGTIVTVPGMNLCSNSLRNVAVTVNWGTQNLSSSNSCSAISFTVPAVKQAQVTTFSIRVLVSPTTPFSIPKYSQTFSYPFNVNFTYTSGNSTTNASMPSVSASLVAGITPGTCLLTIKGSGFSSNVQYSGRATVFNANGILDFAYGGYTAADKRGQVTVNIPALAATNWGANAGNFVLAGLQDNLTGITYSASAKNQC